MLITRKFSKALLASAVLFFSLNVRAEDLNAVEVEARPTSTMEEYRHIEKTEFEPNEKWKNFGIMYGLQWIFYGISQHETIEDKGSFHNWIENPWHPEYDKDSYDFNIFKHSIAGELYYQYYRSRGYSESSAFLWAVGSSLAFEFTIETVTEKPSLQDMYQTPVYGTVVGIGLEKASLYFHSKKSWPYRVLGYILNPFTLIPSSQYKYVAIPVANKNSAGVQVVWSFE